MGIKVSDEEMDRAIDRLKDELQREDKKRQQFVMGWSWEDAAYRYRPDDSQQSSL